jgi:signal transduction histidine kinase
MAYWIDSHRQEDSVMDEAIRKLGKPAENREDDLAASILLVDDEPINLMVLEEALRPCEHYSLVSTSNPRTVFDLCRQHRFDLIILDLNMPYLDGFQVMNRLRELNEESPPPILVVTAQSDQEYRVRALREGAADYLTKPFLPDELLARVGNLVKARLYQKRLQVLNRSLEAGVRERTEELLRSRQMIRELAAHHEKIREAERARIAREIHDEFGQYLTALRMDTAMLDIRHGADNPELKQHLADMKQTIDTSIGVVRNLAATLRPGALDMGLVSAAEWLLAGFKERTGIPYRLHAPREDLGLDDERATAAFRILQEALTNITRYAQASEVDVAIELADAALVMVVRDDGIGFDPAEARNRKTFGLMGIRERALMFGGESKIDSEPGVGTILRVRIPLKKQGNR